MPYAKPVADRQRRNLPKVIEAEQDEEMGDEYEDDDRPGQDIEPLDVYAELDGEGNANLAKPTRPIPPVPQELDDLSPRLRNAWDAFWGAPVAQIIDEGSDMLPAIRLFRLYKLDEQLDRALQMHMEHFLKQLEDDPDRAPEYMSEKSRLDDKLVAARLRCATESRMLEAQMGITPKSRLALGVALFVAGNAAQGSHVDDAHWAG